MHHRINNVWKRQKKSKRRRRRKIIESTQWVLCAKKASERAIRQVRKRNKSPKDPQSVYNRVTGEGSKGIHFTKRKKKKRMKDVRTDIKCEIDETNNQYNIV